MSGHKIEHEQIGAQMGSSAGEMLDLFWSPDDKRVDRVGKALVAGARVVTAAAMVAGIWGSGKAVYAETGRQESGGEFDLRGAVAVFDPKLSRAKFVEMRVVQNPDGTLDVVGSDEVDRIIDNRPLGFLNNGELIGVRRVFVSGKNVLVVGGEDLKEMYMNRSGVWVTGPNGMYRWDETSRRWILSASKREDKPKAQERGGGRLPKDFITEAVAERLFFGPTFKGYAVNGEVVISERHLPTIEVDGVTVHYFDVTASGCSVRMLWVPGLAAANWDTRSPVYPAFFGSTLMPPGSYSLSVTVASGEWLHGVGRELYLQRLRRADEFYRRYGADGFDVDATFRLALKYNPKIDEMVASGVCPREKPMAVFNAFGSLY